MRPAPSVSTGVSARIALIVSRRIASAPRTQRSRSRWYSALRPSMSASWNWKLTSIERRVAASSSSAESPGFSRASQACSSTASASRWMRSRTSSGTPLRASARA